MPAMLDPGGPAVKTDESIQSLLSAAPKSVLFLPLYGEAHSEPLCFVLRVEGVTCLLDCGWSESCDLSLIKPLALIAPHVDVVLLSHADIKHVGALPYAVAKLGLKAPIYATLPVQKMGQMYLYDLLVSKEEVSQFDAFTLDDVDAAFERITGVRFSQQIVMRAKSSVQAASSRGLENKLADVRITAYAAGHSLGGAVWHISVQQEDFVYGVSMNIAVDRHLAACKVQAQFHRPALLITDASSAGRPDRPANHQQQLLDAIMGTLRSGRGNVLLPVDTAGRVFELITILEAHWAKTRLSYPLVFLSRTSTTVLDFAKSQLEFLSEELQKGFTSGHSDNPFNTKYLKPCNSLEELMRLPQQHNMVVLASSSSLDIGLSQQLLLHWAADPANLILFTRTSPPSSLAYALQHHSRTGAGRPLSLNLRVGRRVPLTAAEVKAKEDAEAAAAAVKAELVQPKDEPMDEGRDGPGEQMAATRRNTASVAQQGRAGGVVHAPADEADAASKGPAFAGVLIDGFVVPPEAVAPMFPFDDDPGDEVWDEFGVVADLHDICGRTHYEDDDDMVAVGPSAAPDDVVAIVQQPPSKVVYDNVALEVRARVLSFDFEGLASEKSFVSTVRKVAPRNLLLIQRPPSLEATLLPKVTNALSTLLAHVHLPSTLLAVTLPATACYTALLTPELNRAIEGGAKKELDAYSLQWFDAKVRSLDPLSLVPVLDVPPASEADEHTPAGVFLGDMMVVDIKNKLKSAGFNATTQGVAAVVEDEGSSGARVLIRQGDPQAGKQLIIEGNICPLYYRVRDFVYEQYRLVS